MRNKYTQAKTLFSFVILSNVFLAIMRKDLICSAQQKAPLSLLLLIITLAALMMRECNVMFLFHVHSTQ